MLLAHLMLRFLFIALCSAGPAALMSTVPAFAEDAPEPSAPPAAEQASDPAAANTEESNPSITLKGSVWRTKPGIVFLKTPVGLLTLSSTTTLKDLRGSQEVSFWIHGASMAVDVRKRTDGALVHRYLSGPFTAGEENQLPRWTPEGEQSFPYGVHEARFAALHQGDPVTVEVDEAGAILGLHDLQFDLQVGQIPARGAQTHVLLSGTVSKLKSNFIFFRTPVGVINVNAKIGIKNVKVGQTMTLHVHQHHVVADLSPAKTAAPTHRFVTGPLEFATEDRTSVKLWTPEGEQTFSTEQGKSALASTKDGAPITVELDAQGAVVGFHRFN